MKIIRPVKITDANLVSSSVPETDYAEWAAGSTYAAGARAIKAATHRVYESVQAGNIGHDPATDSGAWWIDVGATNRWTMLDGVVGTQCAQAESIVVRLNPGRINAVALLGLDAESVTVEVMDGATLIYQKTVQLEKANVYNWLDYFFEPIIRDTVAQFTDLPQFGGADVYVTISNPGATARCGELVVGLSRDLGSSKYGSRHGIVDYSKKNIDSFGNISLIKGAYSKRSNVDLYVANEFVFELQRILEEYRATAVVWLGSSLFASDVIYGFFRDFEVVIQGPVLSNCNLQIEGLT